MLQEEHSVILSTFIKLPFVIKIFVLSIFEWPFNAGFTVKCSSCKHVGLYFQSVENSLDLHQMALSDAFFFI